MATSKVSYTYKAVRTANGTLIEPTEVLAPHAAELSCAPTVKQGCRALVLKYAEKTTATGEGEAEWGEYEGRLKEVLFAAYNPSAKAVQEVAVAQYTYDKKGRLRAEWDPRIKPALKTVYGYDNEGHVTVVSPPNQEPWLIGYGTSPADASTGRVVSVTRPSSATALGVGTVPVPTIGEGQLKSPGDISVDSKGDVWIADTGDDQVQEFSSTGEYIRAFGSAGTGNGQLDGPNGLALDKKGDVWVADTFNSRLEEFSSSGAYMTQIKTEFPYGVTVDTSEHLWVTNSLFSASVSEFTTGGEKLRSFGSSGTGNGQFKSPWGIALDSSGDVWVADSENNRVQEFSSTGTYLAQHTVTKPKGLAIDSSGHLWLTRTASIEEMSSTGSVIGTFGTEGAGNGQFKGPDGIALDSSGNVWTADAGNNRVQEFSSEGVYTRQFGSGSPNAPVLSSSTALVGLTLSVSTGHWKNDPLAYGFQWLRCNSGGGECKPIPGADNQTYTPVKEDMEHRLEAEMRASNAAGTSSAVTTSSGIVTEFGYLSQFGWEGTGNEQFKHPANVAVNASGDVWVLDKENDRVQEFSPAGEYIRQFGSKGTGNAQFDNPYGLTVDKKGDIWVADSGNNRIQEFSSTGTYMTQFEVLREGTATMWPMNVFVDSSEHIWVTGQGALLPLVAEYTMTGEKIRSFCSWGTGNGQCEGAWGIAVDSSGDVWVAEHGTERVQKFSATGEFLAQYPVEKVMGLALDSSGHLWLTRPTSIEEMSSSGTVLGTWGSEGTGNGQFKEPQGLTIDASGNVWVADTINDRVQKLGVPKVNEEPPEPPNPGTSAVTTVEYNVPLSGTGLPNMTSVETEKWGQKDDPTEATAIFPPDEPQGWPAASYKRATISYFDPQGRTVNVANPAGGVLTSEYNETNDLVRLLSADNRASALKEGTKSAEVAKLLDSESVYNEEGGELLETTGPQHKVKLSSGSEAQARSHVKYYYNEGAPTEGGPYHLVTKSTSAALVTGKEEDVRTTVTAYAGQSNLGWKLRKPTSVTIDPSGLKLTSTTLYNATTGSIIETRSPRSKGLNEVHDTKTIYYSAAANSEYPTCGGHVEWEGMPCETLPGAQPTGSQAPSLPVTIIGAYNMWGEPETTTETFPTSEKLAETTRTKKITYNEAGQPATSEETSTSASNKALPKVTTAESYGEVCGQTKPVRCVTQSTTEGETTQTITSIYDTLGRLVKYTDADSNTTTYEYEESGDGRLIGISDAKGSQSYAYDPTTGMLTKLVDSAAGTFTASYDVEGGMTRETYPNGMTATYTHDSTGDITGIEYVKTTHCTEKCVWFSETTVPSIHGETLTHTNTLTNDTYTYDAAGRLTQVTETPTGKGCVTRIYGYDGESNRTSLTTREPGSEGKCASEGGITESHTYDGANRLSDTSVAYDPLGNIIKLPTADAGGHELTSEYVC